MEVGSSALAAVSQVVEELEAQKLRASAAEGRAIRAETHAREAEARAVRAEGLLARFQAVLSGIENAPVAAKAPTAEPIIAAKPTSPKASSVETKKPLPRKPAARRKRAASVGFGMDIAIPSSKSVPHRVNPKTKNALLDAVRDHPGETWEQLRRRVGKPVSPHWHKACNELRDEGACKLIDGKVFLA